MRLDTVFTLYTRSFNNIETYKQRLCLCITLIRMQGPRLGKRAEPPDFPNLHLVDSLITALNRGVNTTSWIYGINLLVFSHLSLYSLTGFTSTRRAQLDQSTSKMPPSNSNPEPNERTSLLSKDSPKPIEPSLSDAITPETSVNGNGSASKGDGRDEEVGEVEEGENPLFEGNDKVAQKMYLLFPAVSIGVRTRFLIFGIEGMWRVSMSADKSALGFAERGGSDTCGEQLRAHG
jgi:hypothetical protein